MESGSSKQVEVVKEQINWLELPRDVLIHIFIKVGTVDVLYNVQRVCSLWRKVSKVPQIFRCIDLRKSKDHSGSIFRLKYAMMVREALNRSCGECVEFSMDYFGPDELIQLAIAKPSSSLRCLRLAHNRFDAAVNTFWGETFITVATANPMLEEIDLYCCLIGIKAIQVLGQTCKQLKTFRLTNDDDFTDEIEGPLTVLFSNIGVNREVFAIAENMPELRRLYLLGENMNNTGLQAILDKCLHLEYLDLRNCKRLDLKGDLLKRCEKIREVRLPNESTDDYEFRRRRDGE